MRPTDHDNPEWTAADFARGKPATEVLPPEAFSAFPKSRIGRPRKASPKKAVSIRLDADIVERLQADGPGWQTRVNDILRREVERAG